MKRWAALFSVLYCLRSDGVYVSYSGTDQSSIDSMLSGEGLSCQYLAPSAYSAGVSAQQAAAIAAQQAQRAAMAPYQLELSTTMAAIAALGTGYVGANAITQLNYNAKMIRIIQLKKILGIQ